jgi:hypothetical protein
MPAKRKISTTWISANEAIDMLEITREALRKVVAARKITVRSLPGEHPRYLRADVDRLLSHCTTPAVYETAEATASNA